MEYKERPIHEVWVGDNDYTVTQLEEILKTIKHRYGAKAVISLDAGYNNINVNVTPSKKPQL